MALLRPPSPARGSHSSPHRFLAFLRTRIPDHYSTVCRAAFTNIAGGMNQDHVLVTLDQGPARDQGEEVGNGKPPKTPQVAESTKDYDAFLCHASEDKDAVVRPFAHLMRKHGLRPWLDEREINWGHNLAKKIQEGLARSRFVVVFLSSAFLSKKGWTDKELNTALSMDDGENPLVLPVVLGIKHEELEAKYPLVSAKLYRAIPDYDPAKPVRPGELSNLVEELKNMIGVSDRRTGRGRP